MVAEERARILAWRQEIVTIKKSANVLYSMCSLVVSVLDSPAVDPRSNPGSGSALLMSEKSQAVYYISSCHYANRQKIFQYGHYSLYNILCDAC